MVRGSPAPPHPFRLDMPTVPAFISGPRDAIGPEAEARQGHGNHPTPNDPGGGSGPLRRDSAVVGDGELEGEDAAVLRRRLDPDASLHRGNELAADIEAEP